MSVEPDVEPTAPRSPLIVGRFTTEQGKVVEVYGDRLVIKSPSLRVENHLTLTTGEAEVLAELLLGSLQRERGQSDHDDEVVT